MKPPSPKFFPQELRIFQYFFPSSTSCSELQPNTPSHTDIWKPETGVLSVAGEGDSMIDNHVFAAVVEDALEVQVP